MLKSNKFILLFLFSLGSYAGIPHNFSAGDKITFDKINENFQKATTILYQKKVLQVDKKTDGEIADLSFSNLTPNKLYRVSGVIYFFSTGGGDMYVDFYDGSGDRIGRVRHNPSGTSTAYTTIYINFMFKAPADGRFVPSAVSLSTADYIYGLKSTSSSNERDFEYTHLVMEELPHHVEHSGW